MIAWGQALLLIPASAAGTLAVTWIAQRWRQADELAMQQQRLEAERQSRKDEAIRATRSVQLQPVFDVLAELEEGYAHRRWKALVDQAEREGALTIIDRLPDGMSVEMLKRLGEEIPAPHPKLAARAAVVRLRIDDEGIRRDLLELALGVIDADLTDADRLHKIADLHTRLERYAAAVDPST